MRIHHLAAICAASFPILVSCGGGYETALESYCLNCVPKSVSVHADVGELDHVAYFNARGQLDSLVYYNPDGSFRYREIYRYDRNHRLSGFDDISSDGMTEGWAEYAYEGRFIRSFVTYGMNSQELHRWEHVNDGRHIVESVYSYEGSPDHTVRKTYSEDGLTCDEYSFRMEDGQEQTLGSAHYTYVSEGKLKSISSDETNLSIDYGPDGLPVHTVNILLDSTCELVWQPDLLEHPERWYRYLFDERGNWIQRTEHSHPDSAAVAVITRQISY